MSDETRATIKLVTALTIFGTLGIFVRRIGLPSAALSLTRGVLGSSFLVAFVRMTGRRVAIPSDLRMRFLLVLSGIFLTLNWVFLFEAYRYTTLPTAELAYEMAPVFVMLVSPVVLGEHLTKGRLLCLALAVVGMVLVSGVLEPDAAAGVTLRGVCLGLIAASFYASVIVLGQFLGDVDSYTTTIVQLAVAGIFLIPYVAITTSLASVTLDALGLLLLLVVGVVHTGIAFVLWFGSMDDLPAQKVAILGYVDPLVALVASAVVLGEALTPMGMLGAAFILGSTLASELLH